MRAIGIDPGLSGAVAVIYPSGSVDVHDMETQRVSKSKRTLDLVWMRDKIEQWRLFGDVVIGIELQHVMPKQGASSTGKTMLLYGQLIGMLTMARVPFEVIRSQDWKRALGIPAKSEKGASLIAAERLFPGAELRGPRGGAKDGRADALLIAEYMRRRAVAEPTTGGEQ